MENLIQYVNPCNKAFHAYLQDNDLNTLILTLWEIESEAGVGSKIKNASLWFKFGKDDTLAIDILVLKRSLMDINRQYIIEQFESVTSLTGAELQVFYS